MPATYVSTAGWSRGDLIGKAILNLLALIGFLILWRAVRRRSAVEPKSGI
jgi:hypothetical protein